MIKTFEQFINENLNSHNRVLFDNDNIEDENYDQLEMLWDDFMSELDDYEYNNDTECVVIGSVGRWNGRFNIETTYFDTLKDAILKCISECDYYTITVEDGVIHITAKHHDGANEFEIRRLTKLGIEAYEEEYGFDQNDLKHKEYFDKFDI